MNTIYKIGAIILNSKRILIGKKGSKFIIPGGKIEEGENHEECLKRELKEELGVDLISQEFFGTFEDDAALDPGMKIKMDVYIANVEGEPKASSEIEKLMYLGSKNQRDIKLGSILEKFVIPKLLNKGLID
jgi:8-oxo-dGTP diphosphatase